MAKKARIVKLNVNQLKRMISEETARIADVKKQAKKTKEVDAEDYADTLEKDIDHLKAMKVQENRLLRQLKQLREAKRRKLQEMAATKADGSDECGVSEADMDEKYMGFKKLSHSLAHKKGVKDPDALAASIGRKKYGKGKFQKAAAAHHKMG